MCRLAAWPSIKFISTSPVASHPRLRVSHVGELARPCSLRSLLLTKSQKLLWEGNSLKTRHMSLLCGWWIWSDLIRNKCLGALIVNWLWLRNDANTRQHRSAILIISDQCGCIALLVSAENLMTAKVYSSLVHSINIAESGLRDTMAGFEFKLD